MAEITSEPTASSKVIPVSFLLNDTKETNATQTATHRQFNTADTDAWFEFDLCGLSTAAGTFRITLINLNDNSVFNHTAIPFSANPFYYKLDASADETKNEIRHAGKWIGQVVVTLDNGDSATRRFVFGIEGHILDGTTVRVALLEDYNALIATITASKDELTQYNVDYAALIADVTAAKEVMDQAEIDRQITFDALVDSEMIAQNVEIKLTEKERTYAPRLLAAEQQLEETTADLNKTTDLTFENIARNFTVKPNDKVNTQKVYMTIIDDDGRTEVWDKLKPISEDLEVPITIAVPVRNTETTPDKELTRDQLLYLQDELGWEMASHSWTHGNLRNFTAEQLEYELRGSKEELISWGLDIKNFVAPYGTNDSTLVREIASKYYNCGARVGGGINRNPVKNQYLNRVSLGSFAGTKNTLDYYKSEVDKAIDSNGWIIFMTHCWHSDHDATQNQYLRDTILYAQSKGVEIVNLQDGFEKMGNIFEIEDYFSIAKNGFLYGNSAGIHCTDEGQIKVSQIPSDFYKLYRDKVVVSNLRATDNQQFPENNAGTLLTFTVGGPDTIWQQWHPHRRYSTYRRYSIDTGGTAWSAWERTPVFKKMEIIDPVERTIPAGKALVFVLLTDEDINGDVINITPSLSYGEIMWSASHSGGKTFIVTLFNTHSAPLTVSNVKYDINIVKS